MSSRIALTGASGGIGRRLAARLQRGGASVFALEPAAPPDLPAGVQFYALDLATPGGGARFAAWLARENIEAVVHLAPRTTAPDWPDAAEQEPAEHAANTTGPAADDAEPASADDGAHAASATKPASAGDIRPHATEPVPAARARFVAGDAAGEAADESAQLFHACAQAGVARVVLVSSTQCYGAHADNPHYLSERAPLRGSPQNGAVQHLLQAEQVAKAFAAEHPEITTTVLRTCWTLGADAQDPAARALTHPRLNLPSLACETQSAAHGRMSSANAGSAARGFGALSSFAARMLSRAPKSVVQGVATMGAAATQSSAPLRAAAQQVLSRSGVAAAMRSATAQASSRTREDAAQSDATMRSTQRDASSRTREDAAQSDASLRSAQRDASSRAYEGAAQSDATMRSAQRDASSRWFPTLLGHDPLLQLLHEDDALAVFEQAARAPHPGVFNIVAPGVAPLSVLLRSAGWRALPLPAPLWSAAGALSAAAEDDLRYLWVADGARGFAEFGRPRYSTRETWAAFIGATRLRSL